MNSLKSLIDKNKHQNPLIYIAIDHSEIYLSDINWLLLMIRYFFLPETENNLFLKIQVFFINYTLKNMRENFLSKNFIVKWLKKYYCILLCNLFGFI